MKSVKIKSMEELSKSFAHSARKEKPIEEVSALDKYLYRGKSFIDPTLTHLNYTIINNLDKYKGIYEKTYRQTNSVIAYESIITYPIENPPKDKDGNIIKQKEFFEAFVDILQNDEEIKKHYGFLISAHVHLDETTPHLHFFTAPIENKPMKKTIKEFVPKLIKKTGEVKKVERRQTKNFDYSFNASKMMDREFFINQHYLFENKFKEKGIDVELITPEVRTFNEFKNRLEEKYKELMKTATTKKEKIDITREYYEILKDRNPKKRNRAIKELYRESLNRDIKAIEEEAKSMITNAQKDANKIVDSALEAEKTILENAQEAEKSILEEANKKANLILEDAKDELDNINENIELSKLALETIEKNTRAKRLEEEQKTKDFIKDLEDKKRIAKLKADAYFVDLEQKLSPEAEKDAYEDLKKFALKDIRIQSRSANDAYDSLYDYTRKKMSKDRALMESIRSQVREDLYAEEYGFAKKRQKEEQEKEYLELDKDFFKDLAVYTNNFDEDR